MMTARGFGKRSQQIAKLKEGTNREGSVQLVDQQQDTKTKNRLLISGAETPWTFGKRETKFLDDIDNMDGSDFEQMLNDQSIER